MQCIWRALYKLRRGIGSSISVSVQCVGVDPQGAFQPQVSMIHLYTAENFSAVLEAFPLGVNYYKNSRNTSDQVLRIIQ